MIMISIPTKNNPHNTTTNSNISNSRNIFKYIHIYTKIYKDIQIYTNIYKYIQTHINIIPIDPY